MVDWATIVASVVLSVAGSILLTEYRLKREKSVEESVEVEQWYDESANLAAETRRVWQRLFDSSTNRLNLSEIQSELSLLEKQISRHASKGEQLDVNEDVVETLDELAIECRRPTEGSLHLNSDEEFEEFREDILEAVSDVEAALEGR